MRVNSREIQNDDLATQVVEAVSNFVEQMMQDVGTEFDLMEVRVNLKDGRVFVAWEDYSEEVEKTQNIINEAVELKAQLEAATDELQKAVIIAKIGKLAEEYYSLTGMNLYEVI